jgi:voltage-gated potassium channel
VLSSGPRARSRYERAEHLLQAPGAAAALLSLAAVPLDASTDLRRPWDALASTLNWGVWLILASEVVVLLALAPDRRAWLRRDGLLLLIVVLTPPALPPGLQAMRTLRLLQLLRLVRAAAVLERLLTATAAHTAAIIAGMVVIGGGSAFAAVESEQHLSAWDGIWWAIVTVTTVGYGDITPHTTAGRIIAIVVMVTGIGTATLVIAAAAQHASSRASRERPPDGPVAASPEAAAAANVAERLESLATQLARSHGELAERLGRLEQRTRDAGRAGPVDARGKAARADR